ncbi:serine hydrolase [Paenibacillus xanthanilyticus]|uniref:Serine hydrolase n=1 Tax=Paenibacillus xanthanilyticus TaxID=1783531 RepID=A0ABV8KAY5_9BACL
MSKKIRNRARTTQIAVASLLAAALLAAPVAGAPAAAHAASSAQQLPAAGTTSLPAAAAAQGTTAQTPVVDAKAVQAFADEFFARKDVKDILAGAIAVVVKDDKVLLNAGYGYADVAAKKPIDPNGTLFRFASISKAVTSTGLMQLVEQGKVDLHGDITKYLPGVNIVNKTGVPVTVEHLLTHTTGFEFTDSGMDANPVASKPLSLSEFVQRNAPTVVRKPGDVYRYDNLAFNIQGLIIENVSGQPFEQYMQEHVFAPLQMNNATYLLDETSGKSLATGYDGKREPLDVYQLTPAISPDGSMLATGSDLANFMIAHLNDGAFGGKRVLKAETAKSMLETHYEAAPGVPIMGYGFESFFHNMQNGQYVMGKGGDLAGYHSWMWLLPEHNVGGLILSTSDASTELRTLFFDAFMDRFYPKQAGNPPAGPALTKQQLAKFEGLYSSLRTPLLATKVAAGDGVLLVEDALGSHTLKPTGPLTFEDESGQIAAFKEDDKGSIAYIYYTSPDSLSQKLVEKPAYADVPVDSPYAADINLLRSLGAFKDDGATAFEPERAVTRAEFVAIMARIAGVMPSKNPVAFPDVRDHSLAALVQTVYELGVLTGVPGQNFEPDRAITREEAAVVAYRLATGLIGAAPQTAKLATAPSKWANDAVQFVVAAGWHGPEVTKDASGAAEYRPGAAMSKQEAAALYGTLLRGILGV